MDPSQILHPLGGIPLAIAQAALYLRETGCDAVSYLQRFEKEGPRLIECNGLPRDELLNYRGSMATNLSQTLQLIREEDPAAARLLILWSCIHNVLCFDQIRFTNPSESTCAWFYKLAHSKAEFLHTMSLYHRHSIIEEHGCGYYMHPLVHWCIFHLPTASEIAGYLQLAIAILGQATSPNSSRDFWFQHKRILPHAKQCVAWLEQGALPQELSEATLRSLHLLGDLFLDQGHLQTAEFLYSYLVPKYRVQLGADHLSTLVAMKSLGNTLSRLGRSSEAEKIYLQTQQACESLHFNDGYYRLTLEVLDDLAAFYLDKCWLQDALKGFRWVLNEKKKMLGLEDPSTLNTMTRLADVCAQVYHARGERQDTELWEEAERWYLRAIAGLTKILEAEHPFTLNALNNLGLLYARGGRTQDAKAFCCFALAGFELSFGPTHHLTLNIVHNIGTLCREQRDYDASAAMYQRALEGYRNVLGPEHTATANAARDLDSVLEILYQEASKPDIKLVGPEYPPASSIFEHVVRILSENGLRETVESMRTWAAKRSELAQLLVHEPLYSKVRI